MSNSILMGFNLDHSIFLGSSNLFLDEHHCKRNACVSRPLDFLYKLVCSVNQTITIYTTHEQALIKRLRLKSTVKLQSAAKLLAPLEKKQYFQYPPMSMCE